MKTPKLQGKYLIGIDVGAKAVGMYVVPVEAGRARFEKAFTLTKEQLNETLEAAEATAQGQPGK